MSVTCENCTNEATQEITYGLFGYDLHTQSSFVLTVQEFFGRDN